MKAREGAEGGIRPLKGTVAHRRRRLELSRDLLASWGLSSGPRYHNSPRTTLRPQLRTDTPQGAGPITASHMWPVLQPWEARLGGTVTQGHRWIRTEGPCWGAAVHPVL